MSICDGRINRVLNSNLTEDQKKEKILFMSILDDFGIIKHTDLSNVTGMTENSAKEAMRPNATIRPWARIAIEMHRQLSEGERTPSYSVIRKYVLRAISIVEVDILKRNGIDKGLEGRDLENFIEGGMLAVKLIKTELDINKN